jgi:16S rRNA (guanine527-N7)-methyltransferase
VDPSRLKKIEEGAAGMGLRLDPGQLALLGRHLDLMFRWNKTINLTAITDPDEAVEKHVLDSLAAVSALPPGSLLDAGSGAGFPGIPIAIARPDLEVVLVDSVQKKVAFLKNALADLRLTRVKAVAARMQGDPVSEGLPLVSAAIARAYAAPREWLALAEPYLLQGGVALCMLGPSDEVPEAVGGLRLKQMIAYLLPWSKAQRRLALFQRA